MAASLTMSLVISNRAKVDMIDMITKAQAITAGSTVSNPMIMNNIIALLQGCASGSEMANMQIEVSPENASGTLTGSTVVATDTAVINGVTFTCVASGATGNQFNVGADDDESMENLANAINGSATSLVNGYVFASAAATVVTVYAITPSTLGNCMTLAATGGITAGAARLAGSSPEAAFTLSMGGEEVFVT